MLPDHSWEAAVPNQSACPTPETLRQLVLGGLPNDDLANVKAHVSTCSACGETMQRLWRTPDNNPTCTYNGALHPTDDDAPAPQGDIPACIARYRVLKILGQGGFGRVYLASDDKLKRLVAIKVPKASRIARPQDADAYLVEAQVLAKLDHPHIVPVYDVGRCNDGLPFVVSKYIEGSSLAARMQEGRLPYAEAARLVCQVAEALQHAHQHGLVHRDVKPANILIDDSQTAFLADFGLALKDEDFGKGGGSAGTPAYMSPEQAQDHGNLVDGRSDIFSLGVVLYELLTGRRPFVADSADSLRMLIAKAHARPPRQVDPGIPKELERICLKALARNPSDRYTTAYDMARDLRRFTTPIDWRGRTVAALALLAIGGFVTWWMLPGENTATKTPTEQISGAVDVLAWKKVGEAVIFTRLTEPGALPFRVGDQYRFEADLSGPAYLYVFRIDTEGKASPVFPWQPGEWGSRPAEEKPLTRLSLPANPKKGWTMQGERDGMETWFLLARASRLPMSDADLQTLLSGLPAQRTVGSLSTVVWFDNGVIVKNDRKRDPLFFESDINDPVVQLLTTLQQKLQPQADFTTAVSYARKGP